MRGGERVVEGLQAYLLVLDVATSPSARGAVSARPPVSPVTGESSGMVTWRSWGALLARALWVVPGSSPGPPVAAAPLSCARRPAQ